MTLGHPEIIKVLAFANKDQDEVFNLVASLDQLSMHVLARSIKDKAIASGLNLSLPLNFKEQFGFGVSGEINKEKLFSVN